MSPSLRERMRPLRAAAWLGFQIESNWSDPMVFAVYVLARPLATSLMLVAIYQFVVGRTLSDPRFGAIYLGNALYAFVILLLVGLSWAVFEEREIYKTLKYVAASPIGLASYVTGRSLTKFLLACISAVVVTVTACCSFTCDSTSRRSPRSRSWPRCSWARSGSWRWASCWPAAPWCSRARAS